MQNIQNNQLAQDELLFAEVALPTSINRTFTYRIPLSFHSLAQRGCRVVVPFGNSLQIGYIVIVKTSCEEEIIIEKVKDILYWIDEYPLLTEEIINLTHWVSDYYYVSWGEVLKASIPTGLNAVLRYRLILTKEGQIQLTLEKIRPQNLKRKILEFINNKGGEVLLDELPTEFNKARIKTIVKELEKLGLIEVKFKVDHQRISHKKRLLVSKNLEEINSLDINKLTNSQQKVLDALKSSDETIALSLLIKLTGVSHSTIKTLEKKKILNIYTQQVRRDPLGHLSNKTKSFRELNNEQLIAFKLITETQKMHQYKCFLLHGVTGSGKTEVYLACIQTALELGCAALMLVPEIGLTPMLARRLKECFGSLVAILHSSLSEGERRDEWERIYAGDASVIIGTRSAVFAPITNLGLIIVDEEHDESYKQTESPRYHARNVAILRAHRIGCPIILGSATPSIESAYHSKIGKYQLLEMNERFGKQVMPAIEVVDLCENFQRHGKQQVLSDELLTAIKNTKIRKEQTIILLNRRGFSSFLICRSCGTSKYCIHCDITLTYHKSNSKLVCHYCNYQTEVPKKCHNCEGTFIYYVGEGTEQLEEIVRSYFPSFRIGRVDRDTVRRRGAFESILGEFAAGELDILIGTQMIAKGHDFHNVTLVGVISIDTGLRVPDFRSAERSFQLIAQVSGRAGRGILPGKVIVQSYYPNHYVLQCAKEHNYVKFYKQEINFRHQMYYPPFSVLANILIQNSILQKVITQANNLGTILRATVGNDSTVRILGPAAAPITKLKGKYRYQILIKASKHKKLREVLDFSFVSLQENPADLRNITVEIDPLDLM